MEIREFARERDRDYWLEKIGESGWRAGKYLHELLANNSFYRHCGTKSRLLLLTEGRELISFCTFAERDEIPDCDLTPWIGFVYTFPPYRGKRRIGRLFERAYAIAKQEGFRSLYVSTDQQGLYEQFGFSYMKTMQDAWGGDSLIYRKDIETPDYAGILGSTVSGSIDRPLGSRHPDHPDMLYPVNYGYVDGLTAGDGEEQDVYVLGEHEPVSTFTGRVIAVCHRLNDVEDKWIVSTDGQPRSEAEIRAAIDFQEQYFMGELYTLPDSSSMTADT